MLQHAFKEWAVICQALAQGKQALILRKGGIAETSSDFRLEHNRFWLFPTYTHQQEQGIRQDARPLLEKVLAEKPLAGKVRLTHFAEVTGVYHVHELLPAMMIAHLHFWSDETVEKRFAYRTPGLYVFSVRVFQVPQVHEIDDTPRYQGCKSWVDLDHPLPTDGATPVLSDKDYHDVQISLDLLLTPTAFA
jgi:hypothetical protein